jgi:hypothetical protein
MKITQEMIDVVKAVMLNEECKIFDDEDIVNMITDAMEKFDNNIAINMARQHN